MKKKKKALLLAGGCAALALLLVGGWLLWLFLQPKFQETLSIPKEAKVILHFSTFTGSPRPADKRSELYFYGEDGAVLDAYQEKEECVDRFMIGGKNATWFFFQDHTIQVDSEGTHDLPGASGTGIYCPYKGGRAQIGYIEELDTAYCLLNVGFSAKEKDPSYLSIVRFVSMDKNYDVQVQGYLNNITYDRETKQFFCFVANGEKGLTDSGLPGYYEGAGRCCYILNYDEASGEFVLDEDPFIFGDTPPMDNIRETSYLCAGDRIFCLETFVSTSDSPTYDLFLTTFDIASGEVLDTKKILEDTPRDEELGYCGFYGLNDTQHAQRGGTLFFFANPEWVFRVQNGEQISQQQIPFVFSDASNIWSTDLEEPATTFRDVAIQVNNDGDVFVIAQYKDSTIKIFRLEDGGAYTQVWEGRRPKGLGDDMYLTSFMLIDEP